MSANLTSVPWPTLALSVCAAVSQPCVESKQKVQCVQAAVRFHGRGKNVLVEHYHLS